MGITKRFKCDAGRQKAGKWPKKSLGGIASIVFYTTFAPDDSLRKDALRSLLHKKTANFQKTEAKYKDSLFRGRPTVRTQGYNLCKTSITPYVTDVGFLCLYFVLGFSRPSCECKLREPAFLFVQSRGLTAAENEKFIRRP